MVVRPTKLIACASVGWSISSLPRAVFIPDCLAHLMESAKFFAPTLTLCLMPAAPTHFVFVDFENVPEADLRLVAGKPVHVTLLIGKNQAKLDFSLVEQIHQLAAQVELVKLGGSGRNALDMTLAYYLGRAAERRPDAQFFIVSKDKDFEPMLAHIVEREIKAVRCDSFAVLPFLPKSKKSTPAKVPKSVPSVKAEPLTSTAALDERFEKLVKRLSNNLAPRPKKQSRLLAHINTAYGGKLAEVEQRRKLAELVDRGVLSIDGADKVTYSPSQLSQGGE